MPGEEVKSVLLSVNEEGLEELTEGSTEKEDSGDAQGHQTCEGCQVCCRVSNCSGHS